MGLEFGRIAFSSHIPSCHSPVSSIPQLPQLVRRGKLLHSERASSHGFVEQLKLTPFYFCINGPLAIAQFRLFCSSLDSCLCNPTGFKWPPSQLEVIFVPVFLLDTCILLTVLFKSKKKKKFEELPICSIFWLYWNYFNYNLLFNSLQNSEIIECLMGGGGQFGFCNNL